MSNQQQPYKKINDVLDSEFEPDDDLSDLDSLIKDCSDDDSDTKDDSLVKNEGGKVIQSKENDVRNVELKEDYTYSRNNLYDLVEKGKRAIDQIMNVASQTDHPRAYEVVATLLKTTNDISNGLLELQEKIDKIEQKKEESGKKNKPGGAGGNTNNFWFGSTGELLKVINEEKRKAEEELKTIEVEPNDDSSEEKKKNPDQ